MRLRKPSIQKLIQDLFNLNSMNKLKLIVVAVSSVIYVTALFSCTKQINYQPQLNSLQTSLNSLQQKCDSLSTVIQVTSSSIQTTNTNVTSLTQSIDSIKTQVSTINAQITTLNTELNSTNANVSAISSQITTLTSQLNSLTTQLNEVVSELALPSNTIATGLIGYYTFNGNANDESLYRNNGQIFGPTLTTGHEGNYDAAYQFNDNYIEINNTPSLNPTSQLSIAAWVYINQYLNNQNFVSKASVDSIEPYVSYSLKMGDPGTNSYAQFQVALNGIRTKVVSTMTVPLNTWVFLVGVYTGSSLQIYINGTLNNAVTTNGPITTYNTNVDFGRWSAGVPTQPQYLIGDLDDVRLYNRALTATEISYLATL